MKKSILLGVIALFPLALSAESFFTFNKKTTKEQTPAYVLEATNNIEHALLAKSESAFKAKQELMQALLKNNAQQIKKATHDLKIALDKFHNIIKSEILKAVKSATESTAKTDLDKYPLLDDENPN